MKILLATTILGSSALGLAQEEKTYKHCLSPKAFYRFHHEGSYTYTTSGMGFEYYLYRPEGLGYKINILSNVSSNTTLIEYEQRLHYRIPVKDSFNCCPFISSRTSTHKWNSDNENPMHIIKSGVFIGLGLEYKFASNFLFFSDISFFRDLQNSLIVNRNDEFWGRSFSNPTGFKGKLGLSNDFSEKLSINFESYHSRTFKRCYDETGFELSLKWGY